MKKFIVLLLFASFTFVGKAQTSGKSAEDLSNNALEQGNMKADNNDWQGALSDYTNSIGYYGKNAAAYSKRGLARQNLKDYRGAIMDYSKAIYLNNADGASYYGCGMCYYMLGMKDKACFEFTKATENSNNDAYQAIQSYCN